MLPSAGSNSSTVVLTDSLSSLPFMTEASIMTLSPTRRKRGRLGWTITGLEAVTSDMKVVESNESVNATARSPQVVLALGTVNVSDRRPSAAVSSIGLKKASGTSRSLNVKGASPADFCSAPDPLSATRSSS